MEWENTFLDADGEISGYLHTHHNKEYNESWNKAVNIIKEEYLPPILDKIKKLIGEKNYSLELMPYISYNVLDILMADFYSNFYESVFFKNLSEIYLSGHIPCGWKGKYPEGKIMVY